MIFGFILSFSAFSLCFCIIQSFSNYRILNLYSKIVKILYTLLYLALLLFIIWPFLHLNVMCFLSALLSFLLPYAPLNFNVYIFISCALPSPQFGTEKWVFSACGVESAQ